MHSRTGSAGMTTLAVGTSCIRNAPNPCRSGNNYSRVGSCCCEGKGDRVYLSCQDLSLVHLRERSADRRLVAFLVFLFYFHDITTQFNAFGLVINK